MDEPGSASTSPRDLGLGITRQLMASSLSSVSEDSNLTPRRRIIIQRKTFQELVEHCRRDRTKNSQLTSRTTFTHFTMTIRTANLRLYCVGRNPKDAGQSNIFLFVDLIGGPSEPRTLLWKPVVKEQNGEEPRSSISKDEELLRQRLRQLAGGVTSYDVNLPYSTFLYISNSKLYLLTDCPYEHPSIEEIDLKDYKIEGSSPMDAKFCPSDMALRSFVLNGDLYLSYASTLCRLTDTGDDKLKAKTAGVPSFIIQEEFGRMTGYWWSPQIYDGKHYILYEENDAANVDVVSLNCPGELSGNVELMRYPRPGKNNVAWNVKIVQLTPQYRGQSKDDDDVALLSPRKTSAKKRRENVPLHIVDTVDVNVLECVFKNVHDLFPWAEYLIRAGWMPDCEGIWLQLLSRLQRRMALVYVPLYLFACEPAECTNFNASDVVILYEEHAAEFLIKDHNSLEFINFMDTDEGHELSYKFLWSHGKTGYSHLFLIHSYLAKGTRCDGSTVSVCEWTDTPLTRGDYEVCRKAVPFVDQSRGLIYFLANKDDPLENHLYCVDYLHPAIGIRRLTDIGFSHGIYHDTKAFYLFNDKDWLASYLVIPRTNLKTPYETIIYRLSFPRTNNEGTFPTIIHNYTVSLSDEAPSDAASASTSPAKGADAKMELHQNQIPPQIFVWRNQNDGKMRYGCLLKPPNFDRNSTYPVILYVYGGPEVQLVRNAYSSHINLTKFTALGYVVIFTDGRGSAGRGMNFEQEVWNNLGSVEIEDQVDAVKYISSQTRYLDLDRVALLGWSYGGYTALLCLSKRKDFFRAAVAGAPVTVWDLYDTAYTERYMGLPDVNAGVYQQSSVLSYVRDFPDEPGNLMLLHGLNDENVHFQHTSALVTALMKAGKPYKLQIYPSERHALSNFDLSLHMDATIMDFFQQCIGPLIVKLNS